MVANTSSDCTRLWHHFLLDPFFPQSYFSEQSQQFDGATILT